MTIKPDYAAQAFNLDFGDEAPYAFGFLEGNKRINDEIFKRAIERAKLKRKDTLLQRQP